MSVYPKPGKRKTELDYQMKPLNKRAVSRDSIGRYSERSLHSDYRSGRYGKTEGLCHHLKTRVPYATAIATIMCVVGVAIFCPTFHRGATYTLLIFDDVFDLRLNWIGAMQIFYIFIAAAIGALGLMILFIGVLATGATRHTVFRSFGRQIGGRVSCLVLLCVTYVFAIAWILMMCFLAVATATFMLWVSMCKSPRLRELHKCLDFSQLSYVFPSYVNPEDLIICTPNIQKMFCKDYVENGVSMFYIALAASFLILLSMIHYLMCLSANYAHIRDEEKFRDLRDIQYLQNADTARSHDRF